MKKWHSGLQSEDLINPSLYKQHPMKTRWNSNTLVSTGRSGALSVSLKAALRVRGKALNEVDWQLIDFKLACMCECGSSFYFCNH